jgi:hypothetical protein
MVAIVTAALMTELERGKHPVSCPFTAFKGVHQHRMFMNKFEGVGNGRAEENADNGTKHQAE